MDRSTESPPNETLEQFADRIARETRSVLMSRLDDDVIGCIRDSHLVFGKACVIAAMTIAMAEGRSANPHPPKPEELRDGE